MRSRLAVVGAGVAALLVLGGCAGTTSGTTADPVTEQVVDSSVLANALAAAKAAGSARISGNLATTGADGKMTAVVTGVQDFEPPAVDVEVTSESLGGKSVRQVLIDGKAYVQVPELGDQWAAIDLAQFAGMLGPVLQDLDPAALPELRQTGSGTLDGAKVTFYEAELDLGQALTVSGLDAEARGRLQEKVAADPGAGSLTLAIDDEGRLVQWEMAATVNLAEGGSATTVADVRYSDFGVATDITAPTNVIDLESIPGLSGVTAP